MIPLNFTIEIPKFRSKVANLCDVDFVYSATRHNGFNDGLTWNPPTNKSELIKVVKRDLVSWEKAKSFMFTSELFENGEYIGRTGVSRTHSESKWSFGF